MIACTAALAVYIVAWRGSSSSTIRSGGCEGKVRCEFRSLCEGEM
jgi:hypothetical protein